MYIEISKFPIKKENRQWLEQYLKNCLHQNKSELTIKNYRSDCQKFLVWYQLSLTKSLKKITGEDITSYRQFLLNGGKLYYKKSPIKRTWEIFLGLFNKKLVTKERLAYIQQPLKVASTKRHLSSVKNFMEYLKQTHEDHKLFIVNPVKTKLHQIRLKDKDVDHTKVLTKDDWKNVQENCWRQEEKLLTGLLYYGGFRLDEVR